MFLHFNLIICQNQSKILNLIILRFIWRILSFSGKYVTFIPSNFYPKFSVCDSSRAKSSPNQIYDFLYKVGMWFFLYFSWEECFVTEFGSVILINVWVFNYSNKCWPIFFGNINILFSKDLTLKLWSTKLVWQSMAVLHSTTILSLSALPQEIYLWVYWVVIWEYDCACFLYVNYLVVRFFGKLEFELIQRFVWSRCKYLQKIKIIKICFFEKILVSDWLIL